MSTLLIPVVAVIMNVIGPNLEVVTVNFKDYDSCYNWLNNNRPADPTSAFCMDRRLVPDAQ